MRNEHPAALPSIDEVLERDNLFQALERVQKNNGAPGIDGMTADDLPRYLVRHWPRIKTQLQAGTYRPAPVRRVEIPKPNGGTRQLGIPTVLDRLIQQALMQVLQRYWDSSFSPHSHGFRPGKGTHGAIREAQQYIKDGYTLVVDIDLEKFFDRVNHDILTGLVMKRVEDKRIVRLIRSYLNAGVLLGGLASPTEAGVPQGGPLSPLLSNLILNELDQELERRNLRFVRYADDCNIYVRSRRAGQRVKDSVTRFLKRKLKLTVNEEKSAVDKPSRRAFLGFSFTTDKRIRIAPKSVTRLKERLRKATRCTKGSMLDDIIESISRYLRSWDSYYRLDETKATRQEIDEWIRRRLRAVAWKQWKTPRRRYDMLRTLGCADHLARATARGARRHGEWRMSNSPGMHIALSNKWFTCHRLYALTRKTA
jgi:RNA-directed DNA polymerase